MSSKKLPNKVLQEKKLADYVEEDSTKERESNKKLTWYHGRNVNRKKAEQLLLAKSAKDGYFLVRESYSCSGDYVLSVRYSIAKNQPAVEHYKIVKKPHDAFYRLEKAKEHEAVHGLEHLIAVYQSEAHGLVTKLEKYVACSAPPPEARRTGRTNILHQAILSGFEENVLMVLKHKKCPNISSKDDQGTPVLHMACEKGMIQAVEYMLEHGVKCQSKDMEGYSALHIACKCNKPAIVRMLIDKGHASPVDVCIHDRWTPLHSAARAGHLDCVKTLLDLGAPDRPRDNTNTIPYGVAEKYGKINITKHLDYHESLLSPLINQNNWFHPNQTRQTVGDLFSNLGQTDGLFLVRKGSKGANRVLSLCYEQHIFHYEIKSLENEIFYIDDGPLMPSIEHIVYFYCRYSDGLPCRLKTAVSPDLMLMDMEIFAPSSQQDNRNFAQETESSDYDLYDDIATTGPAPAVRLFTNPYDDPLSELMIARKNVEISQSELGQGEFGSVMKGYVKIEGKLMKKRKEPCAIKTLLDQPSNSKEEFLGEARVMCGLDHQNIVKLIGICDGPPVMIIQELVKMGSMLDYLWDYEDNISVENDLALWAVQIAEGMHYLECKKFVHRDLAARNILLASKTQAKISDFGLSRAVGSGSDYYKASKGGRWPVKWYAPESVNYGTFSHASDVWSYGITLYEMFSFGEQPYGEHSGSEVIQMLERGKRLEQPPKCPDHVYQLMRKCWSAQASDRPTFKMITQNFSTEPMYSRVKSMIDQKKRKR